MIIDHYKQSMDVQSSLCHLWFVQMWLKPATATEGPRMMSSLCTASLRLETRQTGQTES